MLVLSPDPAGLSLAAKHLREGGILAFPTETVYGLGAVVTDEAAMASVFAAKRRPLFDPLIAHLATPAALPSLWARDRSSAAVQHAVELLAAACWPGPLTLVLPRSSAVPDLATAGLGAVGIRVPAHPVARALIEAVGAPLVAPSANRFGRVSPTTAAAVVAELGDVVPYVLDGGPCAVGVESTVVAFDDDGTLVVLRPGGVSVEELTRLVGHRPRVGGRGVVEAPGQLESHYAPEQSLTLLPAAVHVGGLPPGRLAVLSATTPADVVRACARPGTEVVAVEVLSERGDSLEAARRLFGALRRLDDTHVDLVAEPWPDVGGLSEAIRDRLRRAAARRMGPLP
jgi:L-threonylcarbamoyladenylate synthase